MIEHYTEQEKKLTNTIKYHQYGNLSKDELIKLRTELNINNQQLKKKVSTAIYLSVSNYMRLIVSLSFIFFIIQMIAIKYINDLIPIVSCIAIGLVLIAIILFFRYYNGSYRQKAFKLNLSLLNDVDCLIELHSKRDITNKILTATKDNL